MRVFLKIEYDGTNYCGWQIQPNGVTVQEEIEKAILTLTGEKVNLVGSGRTDSGVHAEGQVAHFDTDSSIPAEKFAPALNGLLPDDIKIILSKRADDGFHARFSAKRKTYRYLAYESEQPRPLYDRYMTKLAFKVDDKKMDEACKKFIGTHDFKCFLASGSQVKDTVREIYSAKVERDGDKICFTVCGNGFLYNMVRIMMGTLIKVGEGKLSASEVESVLEKGERINAGATMPPRGLTLLSVEYD
ncbi:MAG: tRNA pseudouridine(38-40) synthase TruA [Clostridiales bacterium]|nr:tRNA pseudouridine(38-40) synthase TruA [Clostridiales bacterium]